VAEGVPRPLPNVKSYQNFVSFFPMISAKVAWYKMKKREVGEMPSLVGVSISRFKMPISLGTILQGYDLQIHYKMCDRFLGYQLSPIQQFISGYLGFSIFHPLDVCYYSVVDEPQLS